MGDVPLALASIFASEEFEESRGNIFVIESNSEESLLFFFLLFGGGMMIEEEIWGIGNFEI